MDRDIKPEDIVNAALNKGPLPTLYNPETGQWEEVHPFEARSKGVPIGPPRFDPAIMNRMWSPEETSMGYRYVTPPTERSYYDTGSV